MHSTTNKLNCCVFFLFVVVVVVVDDDDEMGKEGKTEDSPRKQCDDGDPLEITSSPGTAINLQLFKTIIGTPLALDAPRIR